jgi:hypothetical protein
MKGSKGNKKVKEGLQNYRNLSKRNNNNVHKWKKTKGESKNQNSKVKYVLHLK